jgi:plasmid stabilization system protein ParE
LRIRRSSRFENELGEIIDYIAKDKKSAAKAFNRNLQSAIEKLIEHPSKGRLSEDGYRELVHKGYTVPYLIDDEVILILGIFNQNEWKQK